jgi:O-antigen ligase
MSHIFTFSAILMMVGSMAFARLILSHPRNKWLYISSIIITICLTLTLTRLIWLGTLCGLALLVFTRKKILIIAFLIVLTVAFFLSPTLIQERFQSIVDFNDATSTLRIQMWTASLDVIKDYPLTGCGYECLYLIYDQYPQHPILQEFYYNLHNNIFQITVDSGLIGLGAWLGLWVAYFLAVYRKFHQPSTHALPQWIICGSAAAVLSFLIAGLFETNFYDSEVVMVLYFIMALPFVDSNSSKSTSSNPRSPSTPS